MLFSEFRSDAIKAIGSCSDSDLWGITSDAVRLLGNKARFDWLLAEVSVATQDGLLTLPREVKTVLQVNVNKRPVLLRDEWYEYHINGDGEEDTIPCAYATETGRWATFRDPPTACRLVAVVETPADTNKKLRVYGWDAYGVRIHTANAAGTLEDGFLVPQIYGYSVPREDVPNIAKIDYISREATTARVKLYAVDPTTLETLTLIGHYRPNETTPSYRRLRVNAPSTARVKYQRADIPIQSDDDWINCNNREALRLAMRAVKLRNDRQYEQAAIAEKEAVRLLSEEQESLRPPAQTGPQIIDNTYNEPRERMFYCG